MLLEHGECYKKKRKMGSVCRQVSFVRKASMTLECAFILPLFLMVCLTLVSFMDALRLQSESSFAMSNRVRQMAMAGGLTGDSGDENWIDISLPKTYRYPFSLPGVPRLRMAVRGRVYPWIGSSDGIGRGDDSDEEGSDKVIYITDNESVYHTDPHCSHIDLTIRRTTTSDVKNMRNAYGQRYRKCPGFPKNYSGEVYVTEKGEYYYPSTDYGSLTRHVYIVPQSSVLNLPHCSRCAGRHLNSGLAEAA